MGSKSSSDLLAHAESSPDFQRKLSSAKSADDLLKVASDAGFQVSHGDLSAALRASAGADLKKRGVPDWAINSVFLGESVCW